MRSESLDSTKGWLILLVILGHALIGGLDDSILRKMIYYFHMPVFLAITGYFARSSIFRMSASEIWRKYWARMMVPYLIALLVYTIIQWGGAIEENRFSITTITDLLLYPYYHLWYIPAVLLFICYTKFIYFRYPRATIAISFFIASFHPYVIYHFHGLAAILRFAGDERFYCYYFYFLLGFLARQVEEFISFRNLVITFILVIFLAFWFHCHYSHSGVLRVSVNSFLIVIAIRGRDFMTGGFSIFAKIGRISLPIYLWHVLPIVALKSTYPDGDTSYYALVAISNAILIWVLLRFEQSGGRLDTYIYGVRNDNDSYVQHRTRLYE